MAIRVETAPKIWPLNTFEQAPKKSLRLTNVVRIRLYIYHIINGLKFYAQSLC